MDPTTPIIAGAPPAPAQPNTQALEPLLDFLHRCRQHNVITREDRVALRLWATMGAQGHRSDSDDVGLNITVLSGLLLQQVYKARVQGRHEGMRQILDPLHKAISAMLTRDPFVSEQLSWTKPLQWVPIFDNEDSDPDP